MQKKIKSHKIFLGSLPPTATAENVKSALSQYGKVKSVQLFFNENSGFCKGYGHVVLKTKEAKDLILNSEIFIEGRKIFKEDFLIGKKLNKKKEDFLSKRIFVSNLDSKISDQELKLIFNGNFGEVEQAYRIVSHHGKKQPYGFVLFKDPKIAEECHNTKKLRYLNDYIYFRFFVSDDQDFISPSGGYNDNSGNQKRFFRKKKEEGRINLKDNRSNLISSFDGQGNKNPNFYRHEAGEFIYAKKRITDDEGKYLRNVEKEIKKKRKRVYFQYKFRKNEWKKRFILHKVDRNHKWDNLRFNRRKNSEIYSFWNRDYDLKRLSLI